MKFTAKLPEANVNVSKTHPLVELIWLLGGLIVILGITYMALGLLTDLAVSRTPLHVEKWLGQYAIQQFPAKEDTALQDQLDRLLSSLDQDSSLHNYDFRVLLADTDTVNAIALPGGNIIVYSGLLKNIKSENELAMVLAHELGHFAHRDHLRGLGRGLGLTVVTMLLFGPESTATDMVSKTLLSFQAKYSQGQETQADRFGLELLVAHYGHAGGATDFFSRLAKSSGGRLPYLFASHPHPQNRIAALQQLIAERGYASKDTLPLSRE